MLIQIFLIVSCVTMGVLRLVLPSNGLDSSDIFKE